MFVVGMITIDIVVLIDILIDGTEDRAGTLMVTLVIDIGVRFIGRKISALMSLRVAKLEDKEGTLGLPQDALDNISNMAKEMMIKVTNV